MKAFLAAKSFGYGVLIFLRCSPLGWVLTARYPMAFDELSLRPHKAPRQSVAAVVYAPTGHAAEFGSVVRDPSYLYHYLLSLPYRLLQAPRRHASNPGLRFINIGLFMAGLLLMRRVLLRLHLSPAFTHISLAHANTLYQSCHSGRNHQL